jgi:hypothetical protein
MGSVLLLAELLPGKQLLLGAVPLFPRGAD